MDAFELFPAEVWYQIFCRLHMEDMMKVSTLCLNLYFLCEKRIKQEKAALTIQKIWKRAKERRISLSRGLCEVARNKKTNSEEFMKCHVCPETTNFLHFVVSGTSERLWIDKYCRRCLSSRLFSFARSEDGFLPRTMVDALNMSMLKFPRAPDSKFKVPVVYFCGESKKISNYI